MALDQIANETPTIPVGPSAHRYRDLDRERLVSWTRQHVTDTGQVGEPADTVSAQAIEFGDLLRQYRKAAGLTQEDVAYQAKISVRGLSNLERGIIRAPRPYTIRAIADALQLSAEDESCLRAAVRRARRAATGRLTAVTAQPPVQTVLIANIRGYNPCMDKRENDPDNGLAIRFVVTILEA